MKGTLRIMNRRGDSTVAWDTEDDGKAISIEIPASVVREITYTEPAVRGDTSGKVLKPATINTGFKVPVPLFCETGDRIEIDTRTGEYKRRVNA